LTKSDVEKGPVFQWNSLDQFLKVRLRLADLFGIERISGKVFPVFTKVEVNRGSRSGSHSAGPGTVFSMIQQSWLCQISGDILD
jgi:hypothetical protein